MVGGVSSSPNFPMSEAGSFPGSVNLPIAKSLKLSVCSGRHAMWIEATTGQHCLWQRVTAISMAISYRSFANSTGKGWNEETALNSEESNLAELKNTVYFFVAWTGSGGVCVQV